MQTTREDGLDDLKKDILGCYKNPEIKEGVGSGPVREFLLCAMYPNPKPILLYEREEDHKILIQNTMCLSVQELSNLLVESLGTLFCMKARLFMICVQQLFNTGG